MTEAAQLFRIKTATAPKTGMNAEGGITYAVLRDETAGTLYLYLLANSSGGYFNREPVSLDAIRRCLDGLDAAAPIPAKTFRSAFKGKSVNNSGFLCAVLRHEGLLAPAPDAAHQHVLAGGDWSAWTASMLSQPAEPFEPPAKPGPPPETPAEPPEAPPLVSDPPAPSTQEHRKAGRKLRKRVTESADQVVQEPLGEVQDAGAA